MYIHVSMRYHTYVYELDIHVYVKIYRGIPVYGVPLYVHRDITLYLWGTPVYKGLPIYVGVALYIYLVGSVVFHRRAALLSKASDDGLCMCKHVHIYT